MSREICISLQDRSYRIVVAGHECWAGLALPELREQGRRAVLVTDERVGPLWSQFVRDSLTLKAMEVSEIRVPDGEPSKDLGTLGLLLDAFLRAGLRRDGWVVALGGGVVGDLAGFAAATYLRGISLLQIPTTLLAMADSSVGGKVAVNYGGAKNLAGAFYQPRLVLTSPGFLSTLPDEELANGLAEVIKVAIVGDAGLFDLLESRTDAIWARDPQVLEELIARSASAKARIVAQDELEQGLRQLLNLGHTLGHALEAATGFAGLRHGEAVGVGLVAACHLSVLLGIAPEAHRARVERLLARHRLPTRCQVVRWEDLKPWLHHDKKAREDGWTFVLTGGVGDARVHRRVPEASVREAAAYVLA